MKLEGEQLVLDTNILLHWLRGKAQADAIRSVYELGSRRPKPIVPVVVKGELKSLILQFGWGEAKAQAIDVLLRELPVADISSELVIAEYARLDHLSRTMGRRMGKNDLWIAAVASVTQATLLTTDADFDHLNAQHVKVERVDL